MPPTRSFLLAFETIFLQGNDLEEDQSRGLAHCIDRNHDNDVSRAEWYKLYNKWQNSGLVMDAFLDKVRTHKAHAYARYVRSLYF